jgi:hypothetical protein
MPNKPATAATPLTVAQRQRHLRERRTAQGWHCLQSTWIDPDAAAKLRAWMARGLSETEAINQLLKRSRP